MTRQSRSASITRALIVTYWAITAAASRATSITSSSVLHWAATSSKPPSSMIARSMSTFP
jgi:hypothetical protein